MRIGKWNIDKKNILLLLLNVVLVVACIMVSRVAETSSEKLYSQKFASRWEEKRNSYAQVSAFISPGEDMQMQGVQNIRNSILEKMTKDSLMESKKNARVWVDAYSGECTATVWRETNNLSVTAVGVGGDFFLFHPIPLLSGGYISDSDLNQDRVVVDENFAWAMFGSNDIVGMQIWMDNTVYTIAGVVEVDENPLYRTAYGKNNRIYMSYEQLKKQQENLKVTAYEMLMPNPLSNYAYYALRTACGLEENQEDTMDKSDNPLDFGNIEVVENSNRYNFIPLYQKWKNRKYQSMRTTAIGYPFWENLARVEETKQMQLWKLRIILLICPMVCLILLCYHLWTHRTWTVKGILSAQLEKLREKREEKAEEERRRLAELEEDEETDTEEIEKDAGEESSQESGLQAVTSEDIFHL